MDIAIDGLTIYLLGGVQINADPTNTGPLFTLYGDRSFAIIGSNQEFNTKSNYYAANTSTGGAIIESSLTTNQVIFETDGSGGEQTSFDIANITIVQNGDVNNFYLLETCALSVRNCTLTNTRDDQAVIYLKGGNGFRTIIEECQLLQDIAAIQFDCGGANFDSFMSIHNTQIRSKSQVNGRGWIETVGSASAGIYQQWGNNIFWIPDLGNKFYAWVDSNSGHVADVDVIAACFTNSLTLSKANNTTAGGGSILSGNMPMSDPLNFLR
mgnify:FL=1